MPGSCHAIVSVERQRRLHTGDGGYRRGEIPALLIGLRLSQVVPAGTPLESHMAGGTSVGSSISFAALVKVWLGDRGRYHEHLARSPHKHMFQQLAWAALKQDFTLLHQGEDPNTTRQRALCEFLTKLQAYCPEWASVCAMSHNHTCRHEFICRAPGAQTVYLVGDFNRWINEPRR